MSESLAACLKLQRVTDTEATHTVGINPLEFRGDSSEAIQPPSPSTVLGSPVFSDQQCSGSKAARPTKPSSGSGSIIYANAAAHPTDPLPGVRQRTGHPEIKLRA